MTPKTRVERLLARKMRMKMKEQSGINDHLRRFNSAWDRGLLLCKDGKERTPKEWFETLPDCARIPLQELIDREELTLDWD